MSSVQRSSGPVATPRSSQSTAAPAPTQASTRSAADQSALKRDLDTFETTMNTKNNHKLEDIAAKTSRVMLDALIDPAAARRELTQGVVGPNGEVLKPKPDPGSERAKFLERVASGENIPKEEVMKMAEKVKTTTNCSRMVWDLMYSNLLANLKAEKRVW